MIGTVAQRTFETPTIQLIALFAKAQRLFGYEAR